MMKLILNQEVPGLGSPGDVVEVRDGYGRNYLIPRGDAVRWTRGGQKTIDQIKSARKAREVRDEAHAAEIKGKLEAEPVNVAVKAGQGGRLFGAVTPADIATALGEATGEQVDKRSVIIGNPIKALGPHHVSVKLHDEVTAEVELNVVPV